MSLRTFHPTVRRILAGTALTVAFSLFGPSPVQAADASEPVHEGTLWEAAWAWIESWVATADAALSIQPVPDAEAERSVQDAGWTIDPDG